MTQNLIGNVYGDWVVISEGRARGPKGIFRFWVCKCKCGFERTFHTSYLNTGKATCCDLCKEKKRVEIDTFLEKDTVGRKYGSYTVTEYLGKNKYGSRVWLCRCDCGKKRKFLSAYLFGNGERRATTCMSCYNEKTEIEQRVTNEIPHRFWRRFLDHSQKRKISVLISKEEAFLIYEKQNKKCALSGEDLYFTKFRTNYTRYTNASLDRINSDLPYIADNVQWVHKKVNIMKHLSSNQELIDWCKRIVVHDRAKKYAFKESIGSEV
jgi:hypothetical protein